VNGQFTEEAACPGALTVNDEDFKIGARGGDGAHGSQFRGSVDEALLFGNWLSESEGRSVYAATYVSPPVVAHIDLGSLPAGLVGYWPLER
jgi:hypothetical protein